MVLTLLLDTDTLQHGQCRAACSSTVPATPQATHVTTPNNWYRRSTTGSAAQLAPPQYLPHHRPHMLLHPTIDTDAPPRAVPRTLLLHSTCHTTGHTCYYTQQLVQTLHQGQCRAARSSTVPATPQATHVTTPNNWYRRPPVRAGPHSSLLHITCYHIPHMLLRPTIGTDAL